MNKLKLAFAALAALTGVGMAYATKAPVEVHRAWHTWITVNGGTLFQGTTAQAQNICQGNETICVKAKDNPNLVVKKLF